MSTQCTNPKAVNYDPTQTTDDGSCLYLESIGGVCYAFQDVNPSLLTDKSFTMSLSLDNMSWVFFHDYIPDFYFSSREQLYNLKKGTIYKHHQGAPGVYHDSTPKSFFIDAIFATKDEMILNSVQWITEVLNTSGISEFATFTHITIWNSQQCTDRIALVDLWSKLEYFTRKTQGIWSFNEFRDMVKNYGDSFLLDIFNNFAVDANNIDADKPWFDQDLMHDNWFIIRFEFDNTSGNQVIFHEVNIDASKSYR